MKNRKSTIAWIFRAVQTSKYGAFLLALLQALLSAASVAFALFLKAVIDRVAAGDRAGFWAELIRLAGLMLALILLRAMIRRCTEATKSRMENTLKLRVYETCLSRGYGPLSGFHTGDLMTRITGDAAIVTDGLVSVLPEALSMLVKLVGAAAVLMALDSRFTLILIGGGLLLVLAAASLRKVMKAMHKSVQAADGASRSYLQETLGNLLILRAFGAEKAAARGAADRMEAHRRARLRRNLLSCGGNAVMQTLMYGGYLFGLVWCGSGILQGTLSYGTLTAVLQLVSQLQAPFVNMSGYLPACYAMLASAERLMELESLPGEDLSLRLSEAGRDTLYAEMESIRAEKLTFAYPGAAEPVLQEADLRLPKGSFLALTGESGIGKSTLLKLLLAIYEPSSGQLLLEAEDGTATPMGPCHRPLFAYVPQGSFLMSGSLAEAICFNHPAGRDVARLRQAAEIACADFIDTLPDGFDTALGEHGAGLSEGQLQRLSIARAIYSDAPILLLDEATSALDEQTEARLLQNLRRLTDKTVLIITHRPAALSICDRVVRVENRRFRDV